MPMDTPSNISSLHPDQQNFSEFSLHGETEPTT